MIYLLLAIAFFVALFVWLKTGRSTFWHMALFFCLLEAIQLQFLEDVGPACRMFIQRVRVRVGVVRSDIGGVV